MCVCMVAKWKKSFPTDITSNVHGLNPPVKSQRLTERIKKQTKPTRNQLYIICKRFTLDPKPKVGSKWKNEKKIIMKRELCQCTNIKQESLSKKKKKLLQEKKDIIYWQKANIALRCSNYRQTHT